MKRRLLVLLAGAALCPGGVPADDPSATPARNACQIPDNRILGPRAADRPLPLLSGDASHGFHPACSVSWKALSPDGKPLAVVGCYQGNLLQLANDAACGGLTGRLWVSIRWVKTSGEQQLAQGQRATCQQLETGSYAATRDFPLPCVPQGTPADGTAANGGQGARSAAASGASPVTPPAGTARPAATVASPAPAAAPPQPDR